MSSPPSDPETILIVDDEEPVRRTFREWLDGAGLNCQILVAQDAEEALVRANEHGIDLVILDWNLGAGNDGLQLLEDLYLFNSDVVAIMITGYAHQATPLDAMRMGVRDYLDKNQTLNRNTFLAAVRRQMDRIGPAKRERRLHEGLKTFREAVMKVLPLVQSAAALNDPVPLPVAIRSLFHFLLQTTGACDGVLFIRHYDSSRQPAEICRVHDASGNPLENTLVPFARSVAGTAISLQEPCTMILGKPESISDSLDLQPFERGRHSLLAAPLAVAPGTHVVLELFDKQDAGGKLVPEGFNDHDRHLVGAAAGFGAEMLRQALADRQMQQVLVEAVGAALKVSDSVTGSLGKTLTDSREEASSSALLSQLRLGLEANAVNTLEAGDTLQLAEAVRVLALRHGTPAVKHCIRLVENLRELLDTVTNMDRSAERL